MKPSPWVGTTDAQLARTTVLSGSSATARTAQLLLDALSSGELSVGDRLPSQRDLAQRINVGRSAIREAIAVLETLGITETIPGSGTYLRSSASAVLPTTLSWGLLLGRDSIDELADVREALEIMAAKLITRMDPPPDLSELHDSVDAQADACSKTDPASYATADQAFHVALTSLPDNDILTYLCSTTRTLLRVWIERQVHAPEDMRVAVDEHSAILRALDARDADAVQAAMERHMATAKKRLEQEMLNQTSNS